MIPTHPASGARRTLQRTLSALLLATAAFSALGPAVADVASGTGGRVFVLGFDGASNATALELMAAGEMPNLERLSRTGTVAPLGTTLSAESPVAWCSLNTGQDPSHTGVPGFVTRVLKNQGKDVMSGGMPVPAPGFQAKEDRAVKDMQADLLIATLSRWDPILLALFAGALVCLGFLLAFKLLLRLRLPLAAGLAILLGAIGSLGTHVASGYVPSTIPDVVANPTAVPAFWDIAAGAGKRCVVLDAAMSWDRPGSDGLKLLSGLGLPDARGSNGDWFIYTTDEYETERVPKGRGNLTAGTVFRVDWHDDRIESAVYGPVDFCRVDDLRRAIAALVEDLADNALGWRDGERLRERKEALEKELARAQDERVSVPLVIERKGERVAVTLDGTTRTLGEGEWSDWYNLHFELNPLIKVDAITRVKVLQSEEPFRLFVNVLDMDPEKPLFWQPISQPQGFAGDLARATGSPFETFGWACVTMAFKDELIDAETLMEDIEFTMKWRERLTREVLAREDWDLLMSVFSTPDRVQHMMYQFYDPEHPLYDPQAASRRITFFGQEIELRDAIPAIYRQIDRIIGWVMDALAESDTLLVCADHGFQSFRHQFHVNNWLAENGYLALRDGIGSAHRSSLMYVDWSRTRAYAVGLGMIYLNLEGREAQGIVKPGEADVLMAEIAAKLKAARDPREGFEQNAVVSDVSILKHLHDGPFAHREGDLMIGFAPGYRVSWGTTLGDIRLSKDESGRMVPGDVFQPNRKNWSGGHESVAPMHVAGLFGCSRPVELPERGAHLMDIAPTVLSLLGVERPAALQRTPLEVR